MAIICLKARILKTQGFLTDASVAILNKFMYVYG